MATTMFFQETVQDKLEKSSTIEFEFGRSSMYDGESLIYLNVEGKSVIIDETTGRKLCDAMERLSSYLGYNK